MEFSLSGMDFNSTRTTRLAEDWEYFSSLSATTQLLYLVSWLGFFLYICLKRPWLFPPGPPVFPILGSFIFLRPGRHNGLLDVFCRLKNRYGGVFSVAWGRRWVVILGDFDAVKEALIRRGHDYADRPLSSQTRSSCASFKYGIIDSPYNDEWKNKRYIFTSILLRMGLGSQKMDRIILNEVRHCLNDLNVEKYSKIGAWNFATKTVGYFFSKLLFGSRLNDDDIQKICEITDLEIGNLFNEKIIESWPGLLSFLPFYKSRHQLEQKDRMTCFTSFLEEKIKGAENNVLDKSNVIAETDYFIPHFINEMNKNRTETNSKEPSELSFILRDILMAGLRPTAGTLTWGLFYMAKHQQVQEQVHNEMRKFIASDKRPCGYSERGKVPYTEAVVLEVLRLSCTSPLGMAHQTRCDTKVNACHIPPGTHVYPCLWSVHRDPTRWPDAQVFDPNRFLDQRGCIKQPDGFIPFGLGRRSCPGEQLARQMLFLFLTFMIENFHIREADSPAPPPGNGDFRITNNPTNFTLSLRRR